MGSDQSQQAQPNTQAQRRPTLDALSRQYFRERRAASSDGGGGASPGASVADLPYISYTKNRPIGDSPSKSSAKPRGGRAAPGPGARARPRRRAHDIVVVQPPRALGVDEEVARLKEIPTFLPIMRGTLGLPGARDADVLEGLDPRPWARLTARQQAHLAACAQPLAAAQHALAARVKEVDLESSRLHHQFVERQRSNARSAERLARLREVAHRLSRAGGVLVQVLHDVEELNNLLPEDKRLEPFVWEG